MELFGPQDPLNTIEALFKCFRDLDFGPESPYLNSANSPSTYQSNKGLSEKAF